ncbi:39S ribosomal protein L45 [Desulfovibrio sp. OttesenSCG-928-A18]|nr:39S ribosomal protein L45 [Desulfovibrio sp. OttesenSCG-928-A18]
MFLPSISPGALRLARALILFFFPLTVAALMPAPSLAASAALHAQTADGARNAFETSAKLSFPTLVLAPASNGESAVLTPLAMGGRSRDKSTDTYADDAATGRGGSGASWSEKAVGGSFLGALLFGHPYKGIGAVDMVLLACALLLLFNVFVLKGRKRQNDGSPDPRGGEDRFTVHKGSGPDKGESDANLEELRKRWRSSARQDAGGQRGAGGRDSGDAPPEAGKEGDGQGWHAPRPKARSKSPEPSMKERAAAAWAYFGAGSSAVNKDFPEQAEPEQGGGYKVAPEARVPSDFDVADFLEGARTLYVRLQKAWAAREVQSLAPFVSPQMLSALQAQAVADPEPLSVNIMLVDATLQNVEGGFDEERGGEQEAMVLFNVLMRSGAETRPAQVDEIWVFARADESAGMWRLTSIEPA